MSLLLGALLAGCAVYHLAAILAGYFSSSRHPAPDLCPPVSVLKPVRGSDRDFYACIRSHALQDYPDFELLFVTRDPNDPAIEEIRRLAAEFPARRIELFFTDQTFGPNDKVNGLERLRAQARHDVFLVDDSDMLIAPDHLRHVVAALADPGIGLVTCPYRGIAGRGWAAVLEALWISTDFMPSVLVARLLGVKFALGATLAFHRDTLDRIGGFAPLAPYLADDYQLAKSISDLGLGITLADSIAETVLPDDSWAASWRHRLRWTRTLRACRAAGYIGTIITFAVPLSLIAFAIARPLWPLAALAVILRLAAALVVGAWRLQDPMVTLLFPLIPLADLYAFAIWVASFLGRTVVWRGARFRLDRDGRLSPLP